MQREYKIGDIIECKVTGIEKYGIFVCVDDTYSGLIHISEVSDDFVRNINDYVKIDEIIFCRVIDVNNRLHQLKLSIKDINYKKNNDIDNIKETRKGFLPLKENLEKWIEDSLANYK